MSEEEESTDGSHSIRAKLLPISCTRISLGGLGGSETEIKRNQDHSLERQCHINPTIEIGLGRKSVVQLKWSFLTHPPCPAVRNGLNSNGLKLNSSNVLVLSNK